MFVSVGGAARMRRDWNFNGKELKIIAKAQLLCNNRTFNRAATK